MFEYPTYLIHYGTLGQKWGVRKYQNEDGTWTEEGLRRRRKENFKELKKATKIYDKWDRHEEGLKRAKELTKNFSDEYKKSFNDKVKSVKTRQDLRKLSLNDIEDLKIDKEVENIIGKYANKKFDSRMGDTYGDILKESELSRLYNESREKYIKGYEKKIPKMEKELTDADMITEDRYWKLLKNNVSEEEIFKKDKRLDDAAVTGLKALEGKDADLSAGNKFWFVCEDQTIGYTTIADLANRGYSEKQIKDLVKTANEYYYNPIHDETAYDLGMKMPKGTWHLTELYDGDKFIEDCVKVAKENTLSDSKQSQIKSLIASGKSQEEVAKMLGVSTSTVNKYK